MKILNSKWAKKTETPLDTFPFSNDGLFTVSFSDQSDFV